MFQLSGKASVFIASATFSFWFDGVGNQIELQISPNSFFIRAC